MKGLYKKIGVGVLAAAVVVGAGISQGVSLSKISEVYANSPVKRVSVKRVIVSKPKPAPHKCGYQLDRPRLQDEEVEKLFDKDEQEIKDMQKYQDKFKYIVQGPIPSGELSGPSIYGGRYESPLNFLSCVNNHREQLDVAAQGLAKWYKIGNWNYKLQIINK